MKLCPVCSKNPAVVHKVYGILPCSDCNERRASNSLPNIQIEMIGNSIRDQRKEYAKSIIQPYRSGILSKEYLDTYGTKNIKPSKEEIKNAKYVWKDVHGSNMDISKTK